MTLYHLNNYFFHLEILYYRENTVEAAKSICNKEITKLFNIWEETGIKKDVLITYADQVINHLNVSVFN